MRILLIPICILALAGLSAAIAPDRPRPVRAAIALPSEEREATLAIAAKRCELGLPLVDTPAIARLLGGEDLPERHHGVVLGVGKFTDCGGIYNGDGELMGLGRFTSKTADPSDGNASVNRGSYD